MTSQTKYDLLDDKPLPPDDPWQIGPFAPAHAKTRIEFLGVLGAPQYTSSSAGDSFVFKVRIQGRGIFALKVVCRLLCDTKW